MSQQKPVQFGKYLLLERIGVGGMAEVFKAKLVGAEGFERLVAIKRILPHLVEDDEFVKMFVDEAKIAVQLSHPNIVAVHDLGKAGGTLFIGMEYVLGKDLRSIYDCEAERGGRTPIGIASHIVMKMCEALHHAHFATGPRGEALNVIHRDVSPQNVILSFDGEVKVADFGLAKAKGRMVQTQAGVVKGKLAYMSPEQLRGEEIDHRVDVFGLGIVLYELLTGERLFLGPTDMDTLRKVYEARVPPLAESNPDIQPELDAVVRRALAKDREDRYPTALELHDALQRYVYSSGNYCGTNSLRDYMAHAFPETAPSPSLPPFAEPHIDVAPPPIPEGHAGVVGRPTLRPPGLKSQSRPHAEDEVAPPPRRPAAQYGLTNPPAAPMSTPQPPRDYAPAPQRDVPAAPRFDAAPPTANQDAGPFDDLSDLVLPTSHGAQENGAFEDLTSSQNYGDDEVKTDRPPTDPRADDVVMSADVSGPRLPSTPIGIYEDDVQTPAIPGLRAGEDGVSNDMDLDDLFPVADWSDTETTELTTAEPASQRRPALHVDDDAPAEEGADPWDNEATVIVDPQTSGGHR